MRSVLVCGVQAPFIVGGAEILAGDLVKNLGSRGFRVDLVNLPFKWYPISELLRQAVAWRLIDVTESNGEPVDLVVPTKFPSYLVKHPCKVVWLFHQHREAYDLYGTPFCSFRPTPEDDVVRQSIRELDASALRECRKRYAISKNVAARLERFNGLDAEALYPPPPHQGRYFHDSVGDYFFFAGRLDRLKRLDLVLDAVARAGPRARLKIAGRGPLEGELRKQIARLAIGDRVELLGFVDAEALLGLYARCRAAVYAPRDEDYGYVAVEAFSAAKPVLTTTDAGGPLEFVTDSENGVVSVPEADALAAGMVQLLDAPASRIRELGETGRARVAHITWDHVVDRLTETLR